MEATETDPRTARGRVLDAAKAPWIAELEREAIAANYQPPEGGVHGQLDADDVAAVDEMAAAASTRHEGKGRPFLLLEDDNESEAQRLELHVDGRVEDIRMLATQEASESRGVVWAAVIRRHDGAALEIRVTTRASDFSSLWNVEPETEDGADRYGIVTPWGRERFV